MDCNLFWTDQLLYKKILRMFCSESKTNYQSWYLTFRLQWRHIYNYMTISVTCHGTWLLIFLLEFWTTNRKLVIASILSTPKIKDAYLLMSCSDIIFFIFIIVTIITWGNSTASAKNKLTKVKVNNSRRPKKKKKKKKKKGNQISSKTEVAWNIVAIYLL